MAPICYILAFALLPLLGIAAPQRASVTPFAPIIATATASTASDAASATDAPSASIAAGNQTTTAAQFDSTSSVGAASATAPGISVITFSRGEFTTVFTYTVPTLPTGFPGGAGVGAGGIPAGGFNFGGF